MFKMQSMCILRLTHYFQNRYKVGLMHGRLHSEEKEQVMKAFSINEVQVLGINYCSRSRGQCSKCHNDGYL